MLQLMKATIKFMGESEFGTRHDPNIACIHARKIKVKN
jgi:hypothetical protein